MLRGLWSHFFPQGFRDVDYSTKWMDVVIKYLTILTAAYIDVMKTGNNKILSYIPESLEKSFKNEIEKTVYGVQVML